MLTPAELNLLARLDLAYRRPVAGLYAGERRSPRAARSPEFSDFRPYAPGDDFRQIDWKAYARLERLTLRLYVAEEESALNVVLDASGSMTAGDPPKWPAARRLALAVGFLGLAAMDRVAVGILGRPRQRTQHLRGRDALGRIDAFLDAVEPGGTAGPGALAELAWGRPGMTVVISDFLTEETWSAAAAALRRRRQEPLFWQLLGADEERPTAAGDWKLVEPEAGGEQELTITAELIDEYLANLAAHRSALRRAAEGAGGRLVSVSSGDDLERVLAAGLAAGALVR